MKTNSTYKIEHTSKGIIRTNLTFEDVRKFAFTKRSKSNFSPVADVDYSVIDEVDGDSIPMQRIPN